VAYQVTRHGGIDNQVKLVSTLPYRLLVTKGSRSRAGISTYRGAWPGVPAKAAHSSSEEYGAAHQALNYRLYPLNRNVALLRAGTYITLSDSVSGCSRRACGTYPARWGPRTPARLRTCFEAARSRSKTQRELTSRIAQSYFPTFSTCSTAIFCSTDQRLAARASTRSVQARQGISPIALVFRQQQPRRHPGWYRQGSSLPLVTARIEGCGRVAPRMCCRCGRRRCSLASGWP